MNKYDMKDFFAYYGQSWFLHPGSGEIVRAVDFDPQLPNSTWPRLSWDFVALVVDSSSTTSLAGPADEPVKG